MGVAELLMTAVALAMDAFAVALCKGLSTCRVKAKHMLVTGAWFGGFQALMPLIGYLMGQTFESRITPIDHWVTFFLLGFIGFNMLREAFECEDECTDASLGFKIMLTMALATSIDALAVGVGFALIPDINIVFAISAIGVITFILSALGVKIGSIFGAKWRTPAELAGGLVLIGIGAKMLIQHTVADKSRYDLIIGISFAYLLTAVFTFLAIVTRKKVLENCTDRKSFVLYVIFSSLCATVGIGLTVLALVVL